MDECDGHNGVIEVHSSASLADSRVYIRAENYRKNIDVIIKWMCGARGVPTVNANKLFRSVAFVLHPITTESMTIMALVRDNHIMDCSALLSANMNDAILMVTFLYSTLNIVRILLLPESRAKQPNSDRDSQTASVFFYLLFQRMVARKLRFD